MTNAQLVLEINRLIRGVALNYPDGLDAIQAQLDQLRPKVTVRFDPAQPDVPVIAIEGPGNLNQPNTPPDSAVTPIKRGPGPPKGSKSQHNRPAAPSEAS